MRAVLVAGLVAVLVAIGIGGTHAVRRVDGSNGVGSEQFVAVVGPRQVLCQRDEIVPAGAGSLRLTIGTYDKPGPPLRTSVEIGGKRVLGVGQLAAGWKQGIVDVPLGADAPRALTGARICVANRSAGRLAVAGAVLGASSAARVAGRPARGRVRIAYIDGKPRSTWDLAGTIASRMTFAHGLWDGLAPWVALALVLLGAGGAVRALLGRGGSRRGRGSLVMADRGPCRPSRVPGPRDRGGVKGRS
jgi:hypothetical protein